MCFVDSQEDDKLEVLEPELKNRDSDFVVSVASQEFITALPVRLRSSVYDVAAVRPFAPRLFVGKQTEQPDFTVNHPLQFFDLHDECIVDFDPSGITGSCMLFFFFKALRRIQFRLWWIPWDRRKQLFSNETLSRVLFQPSCETCSVQIALSLFLFRINCNQYMQMKNSRRSAFWISNFECLRLLFDNRVLVKVLLGEAVLVQSFGCVLFMLEESCFVSDLLFYDRILFCFFFLE